MRRLLVLIAVSIAVPVAPANAAFFLGDAIDGPSPDIVSLGDLDLARDGTGALAYVRRVGNVDHVFLSRFEGGVFQPPERIDGALVGPGSQPVVAAADGGRLVVVFVSAGTVHGVVRSATGQAFSAPVPLGSGTDPSVDLSVNGTAFAGFSSAGDVRVARLDRRTNAWMTLPQPADADPARDAGTGRARSRVAVSADGVGVVTWGEAGHVFARKMFGTGLSNAPQHLTPAVIDGRAPTVSELPEIDAEDDSSYAWVVFRQHFADGGSSRILATRQRGTGFDPPVAIDAGGEPVGGPQIDMNGRGVGLAMMAGAASGQPMASILAKDLFGAGMRLFTPSVAPGVAPAMSENNDGLMASVLGGPAEAPYVRARPYENEGPVGNEIVLSRPELAGVDAARGFHAAADRAGGFVVAWVQGGPDRRIVAAYDDRPPLNFAGTTFQGCCRSARPRLTWQPAFDLWGSPRYEVLVDGKVVGETTDTALRLSAPLDGPTHRWQVRATDVRGQFKRTRSRLLRIDDLRPRLSVRYARAGRVVTVSAAARDRDAAGHRTTGMARTTVTWGDSSLAARGTFGVRSRHRYRRNGSYSLEITAVDRAGNRTVDRRTVRIG